MTLTQNLVKFLASHAEQSFSTDALLAVARDEKWNYCMFDYGSNFRRLMLETLRSMEFKKRITSGRNFYRPQWQISHEWMETVGRRALAALTVLHYKDGSTKTTIYPLTVD